MYWTGMKVHSFVCGIQVAPAVGNSYVPGEFLRWVLIHYKHVGITGRYIPRGPKSDQKKSEVNSFIAWNETCEHQQHSLTFLCCLCSKE